MVATARKYRARVQALAPHIGPVPPRGGMEMNAGGQNSRIG